VRFDMPLDVAPARLDELELEVVLLTDATQRESDGVVLAHVVLHRAAGDAASLSFLEIEIQPQRRPSTDRCWREGKRRLTCCDGRPRRCIQWHSPDARCPTCHGAAVAGVPGGG